MFVRDMNKIRIYFFVHSVCNCPVVPANYFGKVRSGFICWTIVIHIEMVFFNWLSHSGNKECSREHCLTSLTWYDRQTDVQTGGREVILMCHNQPIQMITEKQPQVVHFAKNIVNKALERTNDKTWREDSRLSAHHDLSSESTETSLNVCVFISFKLSFV